MLDLRIPTGFFFTLVGLIVVAVGVFAPAERAALTDYNVNLYCGLVMLAFGAAMLIGAKIAPVKPPTKH